MRLFKSQQNAPADDAKKEKGGWRRPANTAFKQQRLKAWQPILTPKTVLPTFFILGILFAPIGGILIWGSSTITEITLDYTDCENLTPSPSNDSLTFQNMPSNRFLYRLRSSDKNAAFSNPQYAFLDNSNNSSVTDVTMERQCVIEFDIPANLEPSVFLYYKLTNFYQNHRRYVKSMDANQLKGQARSASDLDKSDCKPLGSRGGKPIYPCGLIANSIFNDTFSDLVLQNPAEGADATYNFSSTGIAWPGEKKKYVSSPIAPIGGYANLSAIVPPPNWLKQFPNNYTDDNPPPDLRNDEHFQNWMRTAGLPTFTKLSGRNDNDIMTKGRYRIVIGLNYPVQLYKGTKSIVISTVSWIGGKNPFLGWAYVATAALFVLLAIIGTARHLIKPRRLGDMSLLSWNR
jgi:hypothetical protein